MLLRSPCKKLKSYHTPLCQFSNGGKKKKTKKWKNSPKIVAYGAFDETVCTAPLGPISEISLLAVNMNDFLQLQIKINDYISKKIVAPMF